jgi:Predicted ATPase of the ABC class
MHLWLVHMVPPHMLHVCQEPCTAWCGREARLRVGFGACLAWPWPEANASMTLHLHGWVQCALRSPADTSCRYVAQGLTYRAQDVAQLQRHVECVEDNETVRQALAAHGLVAFVGNGAILPRCCGW